MEAKGECQGAVLVESTEGNSVGHVLELGFPSQQTMGRLCVTLPEWLLQADLPLPRAPSIRKAELLLLQGRSSEECSSGLSTPVAGYVPGAVQAVLRSGSSHFAYMAEMRRCSVM